MVKILTDPMMEKSEQGSVAERFSNFYKYRANRNTSHNIPNFLADGQLKKTIDLLNKRYNKMKKYKFLKIRN